MPRPTHTAALAIPGERTGVAPELGDRSFFKLASRRSLSGARFRGSEACVQINLSDQRSKARVQVPPVLDVFFPNLKAQGRRSTPTVEFFFSAFFVRVSFRMTSFCLLLFLCRLSMTFFFFSVDSSFFCCFLEHYLLPRGFFDVCPFFLFLYSCQWFEPRLLSFFFFTCFAFFSGKQLFFCFFILEHSSPGVFRSTMAAHTSEASVRGWVDG